MVIALELSYDGGAIWLPGGGGTAKGGEIRDKAGNVRATTEFRWSWPEPDNPNRRVRGTITINGSALKMGMSLNLLTAAEVRSA